MSARLDTFDLSDAVMVDAVRGLTAQPKTLPAWLFYDSEGTLLFEKITCLTENYLTRIERKDCQGCHIPVEKTDWIYTRTATECHSRLTNWRANREN